MRYYHNVLHYSYWNKYERLNAGRLTFNTLCNENWISPINNLEIHQLFEKKEFLAAKANDLYVLGVKINRLWEYSNEIENTLWDIAAINVKLRRKLYGYR